MWCGTQHISSRTVQPWQVKRVIEDEFPIKDKLNQIIDGDGIVSKLATLPYLVLVHMHVHVFSQN